MIKPTLFPYQGDLLIANAARGTYGKFFDAWSETSRGPRSRSDQDLLSELGADNHELPFRHPHHTLHCVAPLPIARQLSKHQVGFEWSEVSRRYKTKGISFHRVDGGWRAAVQDRRQGSGEPLPARAQAALDAIQERNIGNCIQDYEEALKQGAAPEQARFLLPQSMEAVWVWTGSLLGWANLYRRRNHPDTQLETRQFAQGVAEIMQEAHPVGWKALIDGR